MSKLLLISLTSSLFSTSMHPMNKLILLMTNIILLVFMMTINKKTSYTSMIMMILFMSGLMVMFIYMTSLTQVKTKNMPLNLYMKFMTLFVLTYTTMSSLPWTMFNLKTVKENYMLMFYSENNFSMTMIILLMYILIILIIMMDKLSCMKTSFRAN